MFFAARRGVAGNQQMQVFDARQVQRAYQAIEVLVLAQVAEEQRHLPVGRDAIFLLQPRLAAVGRRGVDMRAVGHDHDAPALHPGKGFEFVDLVHAVHEQGVAAAVEALELAFFPAAVDQAHATSDVVRRAHQFPLPGIQPGQP